jgi:hypothetical protein
LRARTLIVQTENAARQLATMPNVIFAIRGQAGNMAGLLSSAHPVLVPLGRESVQKANSITLVRPTTYEMSEALKRMGLTEEEAVRRAHECGRSVSILARRIPSGDTEVPEWRNDLTLVAAFLAGAWDRSSKADTDILCALANVDSYDDLEASLRPYLALSDAPLETVGSIWAVRAPVDLFVHLSHLIGDEHWKRLRETATKVFSERDPAWDMPQDQRIYARLNGNVLQHSSWIRDGIATTLLILVALSGEADTSFSERSTQHFVNEIVAGIPGLRDDWRVIASLSGQLPMLMEAAPVPLLQALEHLLEGDESKIKPIFQDSKDANWMFTSSPHNGLLWALEIAGQDPQLLQRATDILAKLDKVDPGGSQSNRPLNSLRALFLTWKPVTNASHVLRVAVLRTLAKDHPEVAWKLLSALMPRHHDIGFDPPTPHFKDSGASAREAVTWATIDSTVSEIVGLAVKLAGTKPSRWTALITDLGGLGPTDRQTVVASYVNAIGHMTREELSECWESLSSFIRRHKTYADTDWAVPQQTLSELEAVESRIRPQNSLARDRYLFDEKFPDLPGVEADNLWQRTEEIRNETVKRILQEGGVGHVLQFANEVGAPRYVGSSFGVSAEDAPAVLNAIHMKQQSVASDGGFSAAASNAALHRFGEKWKELLRNDYEEGRLTGDHIQDLTQWWPHNRETWDWLGALGPDVESRFWQNHRAWGIEAKGDDFTYAIEKYIEAQRPEFLLESFFQRAHEFPSEDIISLLQLFEQRAAEAPNALDQSNLGYKVSFFFRALRDRNDVPLATTATLEYRFLPMLRESWSSRDPDSALDRYMSTNAAFFVEVVSNVFRAKAERGRALQPVTADAQARARLGITLLESLARIPGQTGVNIDPSELDSWVSEVQTLALAADRLEISEQYIGKLLSRAVADPDDQLWPHQAVRAGLEKWRSEQIELGISMGKINSRGVTSRAPFDGGQQERVLADQYRTEAAKMDAWPRTKKLLIGLAERWERMAQHEDDEVRQLRLRE